MIRTALPMLVLIWFVTGSAMSPAGETRSVYSLEEVFEQSRQIRKLQACCGPLSLARCLNILGQEVSVQVLLTEFKTKSDDGVQLQELLRVARLRHPDVRAVKVTHWDPNNLSLPAIVLVDGGQHCVVLEQFHSAEQQAVIWDPVRLESFKMSASKLASIGTREVILFSHQNSSGLSNGLLVAIALINIAIAAWIWKSPVRSVPQHALAHGST
jgi:ABC-type bacteriocin/lantibiotic exporter with double-glycine peptidase domain